MFILYLGKAQRNTMEKNTLKVKYVTLVMVALECYTAGLLK